MDHLAAALAESSSLNQLCFMQSPGRKRESDDADTSAGSCSRLLGASGGVDMNLLLSKTIKATSAFSTALRSRKFLTASSTTISHGLPLPMVHIFTFMDSQHRDTLNADADASPSPSPSPSYSAYYFLANTQLTPEHFTTRFLAYILSLASYPLSGSDPDKAILRFAYTPASTYTIPTTFDDKDKVVLPQWSESQAALRPIPAGFFDYGRAREDEGQKVRLSDLPAGSWVVLAHRDFHGGCSGPGSISSSSPHDNMLQYTLVRVWQGSTDSAPEQQQQQQQQQQQPSPVPTEITGSLPDYMQKAAPESSVSDLWEKRVQGVESLLCARRALVSAKTGRPYNGSGIGVMPESRARALLRLL
ncbi:hypothetical protein BDV19DRAFT_391296 [Aspergillus venezuelensis]